MRSYIRKFDDYSYEIAPKSFPYKENIRIYEGDEVSISLKGIHLNDAKDPFNFDIFEEFNACFKMHEGSQEYCATKDNFILGQSDEAIQYDKDEGNAPGTTQDELHFVDSNYEILSDYPFDKMQMDIQGKVSDSIYTFIRFKVKIKSDITD